VDKAVLVLNALLGLGTALAPVFVAVFVGLGFWWGMPVLSTVLLVLLLLASARLPLKAEAAAAADRGAERTGIPPRFWLFAGFAVLYGICKTMNGNWSQQDMTSQLGASSTQASLALTAFWARSPSAGSCSRPLCAGCRRGSSFMCCRLCSSVPSR
jgi:hypothetical protein